MDRPWIDRGLSRRTVRRRLQDVANPGTSPTRRRRHKAVAHVDPEAISRGRLAVTRCRSSPQKASADLQKAYVSFLHARDPVAASPPHPRGRHHGRHGAEATKRHRYRRLTRSFRPRLRPRPIARLRHDEALAAAPCSPFAAAPTPLIPSPEARAVSIFTGLLLLRGRGVPLRPPVHRHARARPRRSAR